MCTPAQILRLGSQQEPGKARLLSWLSARLLVEARPELTASLSSQTLESLRPGYESVINVSEHLVPSRASAYIPASLFLVGIDGISWLCGPSSASVLAEDPVPPP